MKNTRHFRSVRDVDHQHVRYPGDDGNYRFEYKNDSNYTDNIYDDDIKTNSKNKKDSNFPLTWRN